MIISLSKQNEGLLGFLFPGIPTYQKHVPPFHTGKCLLVSETQTPQKGDVIQVKRSGGHRIDTTDGFISFLKKFRTVKITKQQEESLIAMEEEEFWPIAKLIWVGGQAVIKAVNTDTSVFHLFKDLFSNFQTTYKHYKEIDQHYNVVLAGLMTMMNRTKMTDDPSLKPGYKKVLMANAPYLGLFKKAVMQFIESERTETDFLTLLHTCAETKQ